MSLLKTGTVVRAHLFRERFDVMIAVIAPFIIMLESGYGNAWAFAGGGSLLSATGVIALARGIFLEGLIFAMFKLVRLFLTKNKLTFYAMSLIPAAIGCVGMVVSAGCNLGFVNHSGEMQFVLQSVAQYMPNFLVGVFKIGLGLLFPIAVGAFALFDMGHLVEAMFDASNLEDKSLIVERAEQHRVMFQKSQKDAAQRAKKHYDDAATSDVENIVRDVKTGKLDFGMDKLKPNKQERGQPGVTKITPVQQPALPSPSGRPALPGAFPKQQTIVNGHLSTPPAFSSGNTQNVVIPGVPSMPVQPQWQGNNNNFQKRP